MIFHPKSLTPSICNQSKTSSAVVEERVIEINFPDLPFRSNGGNCFFLSFLLSIQQPIAFWLFLATVNN